MKKIFALLLTAMSLSVSAQTDGLPATLPPIPEIPVKEAVGSVKMGDWQTFQEVQLDLPLTAGPSPSTPSHRSPAVSRSLAIPAN